MVAAMRTPASPHWAALLFSSLVLACSDGSEGASGANWPSFGGDLHHTRSNSSEGRLGVDNVADLSLAWEHRGTEVTATPAVVDGIVYFGDWGGSFYAKQASDGEDVWTLRVDGVGGFSASPAVNEDSIFIGDRRGGFHAIDRARGEVLWSVVLDDHPNAGILSSALLVDDMLIVGVSSGELSTEKEEYTFRGSVVALAQDDGTELWRVYTTQDDETSGAGVSVWSSPAIDTERGLTFIGTGQTYEEPASPMSDALLAIEYETGTLRWVRQFTENDVYRILMPVPQGPDADIGAAPNLFTIDGRDVVGVGDEAGVYAVFERASGDEVWATALGPGSHLGGVMAPAAYHDGRIYVTTNLWPSGFDTETVFIPAFDDPENTSELIALDASRRAAAT